MKEMKKMKGKFKNLEMGKFENGRMIWEGCNAKML
jgi:hypothetical protein